MIYLFLSVILLCIMNIVFKVAAVKGHNNNNITLVNYVITVSVSLFNCRELYSSIPLVRDADISLIGKEINVPNTVLMALVLGFIQGVLYLALIIYLKDSTVDNGAALTSLFKQSGFVGGTIIAFFLLKEQTTGLQWIGVAVIAVALVIVVGDFSNLQVARPMLLISMFFMGALKETVAKAFALYADSSYKALFLGVVFSTAFIICIFYVAVSNKKSETKLRFTKEEILEGVICGAVNISSNSLQLKCFEYLDSSVIFPTLAAGTLVVMTLVSIIGFREKTSWKHVGSVILASVGLVLMNI